MDSLSTLLHSVRLNVDVFHNAQYCGDWAVDTSGAGYISFHLVTRGRCHAHSDCLEESVWLDTGDIILFPRDAAHRLESRPNCGVSINTAQSQSFESGWQDDGVGLLCGYFRFAHPASNPLVAALPDAIVQRRDGANSTTATLLKLICQEALAERQGAQAAVDRLAESLVILLIREHLEGAASDRGLAAALADPRISRALDAMHGEPQANWTVEQLAQRCGYESESSFSRAFKSIVGTTPGRFRRSA